ncbi:hypothetical protein [Lewinella sp. 4G2]|uniref:hypothetical protein n=1 Tax=Lewinella sp. 4G2 TaxID=1803372 RepID=UPI0007B481F1|nr:hypothetical protein [Lewinella sp. 4G2]OAV44842.1 hypothetical protein A3850_010220 [Lewinella sp. 4G2]
MKSIYFFFAIALLASTVSCDRTAAVQEAKEDNAELVPTTTAGETPTTAQDGVKTDDENTLELKKVEVSTSPLKDLSEAERNTKLIEATDDGVASQAIAFMESRVTLTATQKEQIVAFADELNLSDKNAGSRRAALKTMRKKIKNEILTPDQLRQFKASRR